MSDAIDFSAMNRPVIAEFRETGGKAGGVFENKPLVLVHHVGAKSGKERIAPLVPYLDGDRIFIFASKGGADTNPDWYHNLRVNPAVSAEIGSETRRFRARTATGDERERIWSEQKEEYPGFADYEAATSREIPVVVLEPA